MGDAFALFISSLMIQLWYELTGEGGKMKLRKYDSVSNWSKYEVPDSVLFLLEAYHVHMSLRCGQAELRLRTRAVLFVSEGVSKT